MIQRATFIGMNSDGTARVSIPTVSSAPINASICCPNGVLPQFEKDEVVFVDWLGVSEYVILGSQYSPSKNEKKLGNLSVGSINADSGSFGKDTLINGKKAEVIADLDRRVTQLETRYGGLAR